jgi:hypothetical protein
MSLTEARTEMMLSLREQPALFRSSGIETGHFTFNEKPLVSFLARLSARFSIKVLSGFFFPCFFESIPLLICVAPSNRFDGRSRKPRTSVDKLRHPQQHRYFAQQFLNFLPLPHGHGSLRPTFFPATVGFWGFKSLFRSLISSASPGSTLMRHSQPCFSHVSRTSFDRASDWTRTAAGFFSLPSLAVFFAPKEFIRLSASTLLRIVPISVIRLLMHLVFQLSAR